MKALRYILLSYLQQHFFGVMMIVVALIYFVPASLAALFGKYGTIRFGFEPWALHFLSFIFVVYTTAMHLRSLIKTNTGALLPHYRRNQLIAAGLLLTVFISVPILINGFKGFPVLAPLAMFLFAGALMMWGIFSFGENVAVLAVIIWLGKLVHELLGYKLKIMIFPGLPHILFPGSGFWIPVLVIFVSGVLFFLFGLYILKMPYKDVWGSPRDRSDPYTKDYDKVSNLTFRIVMRKVSGMLEKMTERRKKSPVYLARFLQPALFSPGQSSITNSLIYIVGLILYIITIGFVFYGGVDFAKVEEKFGLASFLILLYFIGIGILTNDLLQHRHRMADLWLRVQLASRKTFARTTILTYIMVTVKQFFVTTLALFVLHALLRQPFLKTLLTVVTGFVVYSLYLTIAILASESIVSPDGKGWFITAMLTGTTASMIYAFVVKGQVYRSPGIWWFLLVVEVLVLFLFWLGVRKWSNADMNFIGPDMTSQF